MPRLKPRDWRDNWKPDEWWWSWGMSWLVLSCAAEASATLRSRRDFYDELDPVLEHRNMLVRTLNAILAKHGDHSAAGVDARVALEPLIEQADKERYRLMWAHRDRAFDKQQLEGATLHNVLLRGIHPMTWARWHNPTLADDHDALHESSKRVQAQRERAKLAGYHERQLALYQESTRSDVVQRDPEALARLQAWIAQAEAALARLTSDDE